MNGVYKTNINCFFISEMVESCCPLSEIQPWPTIHLDSVHSELRLNFTLGTIIYGHSPHEQSKFVQYTNITHKVSVKMESNLREHARIQPSGNCSQNTCLFTLHAIVHMKYNLLFSVHMLWILLQKYISIAEKYQY